MSKLPTQLKWSIFVGCLTDLKYRELRSRGGSARHFQRGDEDPVTFHEPHGSGTIKQGTLTEYIRKLGIDRDRFMEVLNGGERPAIAASADRFRRTFLGRDGFVSHCQDCYSEVARATTEDDLGVAESSHVCPLTLQASPA